MAVQRRVNWISQARVDVPDMRSLESAASNDFDQLIQGFVTGTSQGYILRGFEILMSGAIGGAASSLQLLVDPGSVMHIASSQSGTILMVPAGTLAQPLNSATNIIVDGAFSPSAINYVSIEYERFIDDSTSAQVYLWNPTTNNETTKNAPRAQILRFRIKIGTATPAANFLPVAVVVTDSGNNVVSVQDARWSLFRLGTGGPTPNPFNQYSWPQGRVENPSVSSSNTVSPFQGGDKAIGTLKDWMDAVMTSIQEIKGTTFWYSTTSSGSLDSLRADAINTVITGRGSIAHGVLPSDKVTPTGAGQINWDQDIDIQVLGSELSYVLSANPTSTNVTLSDGQVAYVTLVRGVLVTPNLIFTNGIPQVSSVGAVAWTTPLQAGDYVKLGSDTDSGYYKILTVDSLTQVTLTENFAGTSTGASGAKGKYAFGSYESATTPSTTRDIYITSRELLPEGKDVFWLFLRTDNGGAQPKVYVRFLGAELDQGEDRDISDTTSQELLKYIGSPSVSAFAPQYVASVSPGALPLIQTLTFGTAAQIAQNDYFFINSSNNARKYYVWFNKDAGGTDPTPGGVNASVEVTITTGMTAVQIANAVKNALNGTDFNDFLSVQLANPNDFKVRVTNTSAGTAQSAVDFNVGAPFAVSVDQSGTGVGNNFIKDGDSLTLAIKELDEAIGSVFAVLDSPDYDEKVEVVASGATPPTSINGPVSSGTLITLPNNTRISGSPVQKYTVGSGFLQVYLNGQFLNTPNDFTESGAPGSASNQIAIQQGLAVGDRLEFRIDHGTAVGGGGGPMGPPGPPGVQGPAGINAASPITISTKVSNYSLLSSDNAILVDCTSGAVNISLPAANGINIPGKIFYVKKIDASSNAMSLLPNGGDLIDGQASLSTVVRYYTYTVISDGSQWWIL